MNWALQLDWQPIRKHDEIQMYTLWMVRNSECQCTYSYGRQNMKSTPFDDVLEKLTVLVSSIAGIDTKFHNSCNINKYHNE